jgi:hypothetical protein
LVLTKKRRIILIALAVAFVACAFLVPSWINPKSSSKQYADDFVGVCVHTLPAADAKLVADSGAAGWIRIDISNNESSLTCSLANAKAYNLSVLGILGSWMFNQSCRFSLEEWGSAISSNVSVYAPYVDAWEIWNEPTSQNPGWQLQADYVSMVQIASPIIRQYDPTAEIVLLGGLQLYTGGNMVTLNLDKDFARNLSYCNLTLYGDAISVHAYPWGNQESQSVWDNYAASIADYRQILGNSSLDVWVTETGQNITDCRGNQRLQAQYLADSLGFFNGRVSHVFWYALHDENATKGDFGLIQNDGVPREAYIQLQYSLANNSQSPKG